MTAYVITAVTRSYINKMKVKNFSRGLTFILVRTYVLLCELRMCSVSEPRTVEDGSSAAGTTAPGSCVNILLFVYMLYSLRVDRQRATSAGLASVSSWRARGDIDAVAETMF